MTFVGHSGWTDVNFDVKTQSIKSMIKNILSKRKTRRSETY